MEITGILRSMKEEVQITTERIDDFVVLLALMQQMDLPGILDRQIARHRFQQGLSWGWVASIWLAHIVSQGDHRKLTVRDWVRQAHSTLERVTGLDIRETDFTDDRLTIVLRHLSHESCWHAIEQELGQHLVRVYDLEEQPIRVDATTVSGYREGGEDSLWQFGHSKDDPTLRQIKAMMATLDPLGLPLALDVVSGEQADDRLYVPIIDRVLACLGRVGLLFVGDCKMSALATRAHLQEQGQYYLTPLAQIGETAQQMPGWIEAGVAQGDALTQVLSEDGKQALAEGYEMSRTCVSGELRWHERVLVVRSLAYAQTQCRHLEERLDKAQAALLSLTPPVGRGKRQITEEAVLQRAAEAVLTTHHVTGLLTYTSERQVEQEITFVGRGRGGANRPQQVSERVRYQITTVTRNEEAIGTARCDIGLACLCQQCASEALALAERRAGISARVSHRTRLRTLKRRAAFAGTDVCETRRPGDRVDAFAQRGRPHPHAHGVCGSSLLEAARGDAGGIASGKSAQSHGHADGRAPLASLCAHHVDPGAASGAGRSPCHPADAGATADPRFVGFPLRSLRCPGS